MGALSWPDRLGLGWAHMFTEADATPAGNPILVPRACAASSSTVALALALCAEAHVTPRHATSSTTTRLERRLSPIRLPFAIPRLMPAVPCCARPSVRPRAGSALCASSDKALLVCIGKTCRLEGSQESLELLRELAPERLVVRSTTCLGRCGGGPHLSFRNSGDEYEACQGVAACLSVLRGFVADDVAENAELDGRASALALRRDGELSAARGEHRAAEALFSSSLDQHPQASTSFARAASRLALDELEGALLDASAVARDLELPSKLRARALLVATEVFIRRGDGVKAQQALAASTSTDRSVSRLPEYVAAQQRCAALQPPASVA